MTDTNDIGERLELLLHYIEVHIPNSGPFQSTLNETLDLIEQQGAKIKRLESRGIEDMHQRIAELEEKLETAEKWDDIESARNEDLQHRIAELEAALKNIANSTADVYAGSNGDWETPYYDLRDTARAALEDKE